MRIAYCAGHGKYTPGKRTPADEREWNFNNANVKAFEEEMTKYEGVELLRTDDPTGNTDVGLTNRTSKANAWGADIYLSFHHNAYNGVWGTHTGSETYYWDGTNKWTEESRKLATEVQKAIVKAYGLKDRGVKRYNFHICREMRCPAILIESGYMDSSIDIKAMRQSAYLERLGRFVAQQVGLLYKLKRKAPAGVPADQALTGKSIISVEAMKAYTLKGNPTPKINTSIDNLIDLFIEEGNREGIRGDLVYCQALKETGFFAYGGIVLPKQNNYGGIGALNDNAKGDAASFATPADGVRAMIQHAKAYANKEAVTTKIIDPRFTKVTRGSAPKVTDLGGRWAWPGFDKKRYIELSVAKIDGASYGHDILRIFHNIAGLDIPSKPTPDEKEPSKKPLLITYIGKADEVAAELIENRLGIPAVSLDARGLELSDYTVIHVGGGAPVEAYQKIVGKNREETLALAQKFIEDYKED